MAKLTILASGKKVVFIAEPSVKDNKNTSPPPAQSGKTSASLR